MIARISAVALTLAAAGCATIVQGPHQRVAFETQPPGAIVRTHAQTCTTPCSLRLKRNRNLEAEIRKPGYEPETVYLRYELHPWILGNIAFLPLAPLGGVVDVVTGAGFQLYPPFVALPLRSTGEAARAPDDDVVEPDGPVYREPDAKPDAPRPEKKPEGEPEAESDDDWKPIPEQI